jgi:hypothetical protein
MRVQQVGIITSFLRMYNSESRDTTYQFIDSTLHEAFKIIKVGIENSDQIDKALCLMDAIDKSIMGIKNLQQTYDEPCNKYFYCKIEALITWLLQEMKKIKEYTPETDTHQSKSSPILIPRSNRPEKQRENDFVLDNQNSPHILKKELKKNLTSQTS